MWLHLLSLSFMTNRSAVLLVIAPVELHGNKKRIYASHGSCRRIADAFCHCERDMQHLPLTVRLSSYADT